MILQILLLIVALNTGRYSPVGPTSFGDSPYQSFSAFAGNPYFIAPDILMNEKLIDKMISKSINLLADRMILIMRLCITAVINC